MVHGVACHPSTPVVQEQWRKFTVLGATEIGSAITRCRFGFLRGSDNVHG